MVGILGNILAGGVAGGAKAYTDMAEERRKEALEKAKEEALYRRQESLMRLGQKFQKQMAADTRAHGDKVREDEIGRKARDQASKDEQAGIIAEILSRGGEDPGKGILADGVSSESIDSGVGEGQFGGDSSRPKTNAELEGSLTGTSDLALWEKQRAMDKEEKAESRADKKFSMLEETHEVSLETAKLTQKQLEKQIEQIGKTEWKPRNLYKDGKEVKAMTQAEYLMYRKDGFTPIKGGDGMSAGEEAGFRAIEFGGIAGMDAPKGKEIWDFLDGKGAQQFKKWADENGVIYAATPISEDGEGKRFLISTTETKAKTERVPQQDISQAVDTFRKSLQSGDIDAIEAMPPEQFKQVVSQLTGGDPKKVRDLLAIIDNLSKAEEKPGILNPVDYKDNREGDPLSQKRDPLAPAKDVKKNLIDPALDSISRGATNTVKRFQQPNRFN